MADIFLSYASEDRPRIRELVDAFEASGLTVFWDRTIPPGKTWRAVIGGALQQASAVVVCWSVHSIESQWVLEEAEVGKHRGRLLPVLLENVAPPLGFASIQAASLLPNSPARTQELDALVRAAFALKQAADGTSSSAPPSAIRQQNPATRNDAGAAARAMATPSRPVIAGALLIALVALAALGLYSLMNRGEPVQASQATTSASASPQRPDVGGPSQQPPASAAPTVPARQSGAPSATLLESQDTLRDMRERADRIQRDQDEIAKEAIRKINQ
jgi:hypothetical protein